MTFKKWHQELQRVFFIIFLSGLVGYFLAPAYIGATVSLALLGYIFWLFLQFNRLYRWLKHPLTHELPEAENIWGNIFDLVHEQHAQKEKMKQQLFATIHRAQASTNALIEGVVILDTHQHLEWWNKSANRLLGLRFPQDKGRHITNLLREPLFVQFFEKQAENQETVHIKSPIKEHTFLEIRIATFGKNQRIIVIRDITRIKQLEQIRSDFIANVSHELKTPITVISGFLETFLDQPTLFPPKVLKGLEHMQDQAERMQKLVHNLIFLVRLETTDINQFQENIPIKPLITEIIENVQLMNYGERKLLIDVDGSLMLYGNFVEIESALSNLIQNAFKYSKENDSICITAQMDHNKIYIQVKDSGTGIDQTEIARVTERFYRVDKSRQNQTGGTGLGLSIVKHALHRHEATLEIDSQLGKGSSFTCIFPEKRSKISQEPK